MQKFVPAKLLITVVGSHYAELVIEALKRGGATGGTRVSGQGLAAYRTPGGLPGLDAPEDLIFCVISGDVAPMLESVKRAAEEDPEELNGMAMVLNVPNFFLRPDDCRAMENHAPENKGSRAMTSNLTLITSIINQGTADQVMAEARRAGAKGGSVVTARGTGTEDDVKFFGISLAPEKEMLLIIADNEDCRPIIQAISAMPIFTEPGGGIVFTVSVEEFAVLGPQYGM